MKMETVINDRFDSVDFEIMYEDGIVTIPHSNFDHKFDVDGIQELVKFLKLVLEVDYDE